MASRERIAILVDDMFFASKINSAASEADRQVERIRSREQLEALISAPPSLIIIDLNSDRLLPLEAIAFLKRDAGLSKIPIVGFVSHVETELIRLAREAGCEHVLPRSAFTQFLPRIMSGDLEELRPRT